MRATSFGSSTRRIHDETARLRLMRPMLPSWLRSRDWSPRFVYFLAIETTRRRLASTSSFFACSDGSWATAHERLPDATLEREDLPDLGVRASRSIPGTRGPTAGRPTGRPTRTPSPASGSVPSTDTRWPRTVSWPRSAPSPFAGGAEPRERSATPAPAQRERAPRRCAAAPCDAGRVSGCAWPRRRQRRRRGPRRRPSSRRCRRRGSRPPRPRPRSRRR